MKVAGALVCFAVAAYAATFLLGNPALLWMLVWFAGALLLHDVVLFPLYAGADRLIVGRLPLRLVNYVRLPLLGTGLTFLLFFPGIVAQGAGAFHAATGLDQTPYLGRWLWLVAAMFALSASVFVVRRLTTR